jgi:hypothetical protein
VILLALISAIRRVPMAAGVARGFHRFTLPILTLLLLGYVAQCFYTSDIEMRAQQTLERSISAPMQR